jgi:gluconokinase
VAEPALDDEPSQRTWCYLLTPGRWFAGGAVNNAGLAVQWVRERFYPEGQSDVAYERLFRDAEEVGLGAEGVLCLPFFTGERSPYWRADARAAFVGLDWRHGPRHFARAVLESVAYRLADVWQALKAPQSAEPARLTGRITLTPGWVQILCDVLGAELDAVGSSDASVAGAALLAQAALDEGSSLERLAGRVRPQQHWRPEPEHHRAYRRLLREFRELYRQIVDICPPQGYPDKA